MVRWAKVSWAAQKPTSRVDSTPIAPSVIALDASFFFLAAPGTVAEGAAFRARG
ncbi:hypothetical protein Skr01_51350 [Sphaerisporangium krabiense]|nr:hypothetical protein Skr01_51350 [Sphaerisporangium krabiense]